MRIKQISITKAMVLNLGNYETARVEVGMVGELNAGEDEIDEMQALSAAVTAQLQAEFRPILEKRETKKIVTAG